MTTPLMLMTLISLAPFPIFGIALLAGRWLQTDYHGVMVRTDTPPANRVLQDGLCR